MHTINLSMPLLNLDDTPILDNGKELTAGRLLANSFAGGSTEDPIKFSDWAKSLYQTGKIEVDASDLKKVHAAVKAAKLTDLAKGQILKALPLL